MTLFPVIMPVVEPTHRLSGERKLDHLSRIAREALMLSAERTGVTLTELRQDKNGAPCPVSGNYWSVSHKPKYVAAVVSRARTGIDIEETKPRTESLFAYLAGDEEWKLTRKSWHTFFRYWTAKEATLKAIGIGIAGLKTCRVVSIPDESHIILDYEGQTFIVEQIRHDNHIASVVKDDNQIEWVILDPKQSTDLG